MRIRNFLILSITIIFVSGCSLHPNPKPRTASDVFFDFVETVLDISDENEFDEYREQNESVSEARRKWQCENLSPAQLEELGVRK